MPLNNHKKWFFLEKIIFRKFCLRKKSKQHFEFWRTFWKCREFREFLPRDFRDFPEFPPNLNFFFGFFSETKFSKNYFFLKKPFLMVIYHHCVEGINSRGSLTPWKGSDFRLKNRNFRYFGGFWASEVHLWVLFLCLTQPSGRDFAVSSPIPRFFFLLRRR